MKADLHLHSIHSNDGEFSIADIIELCIENDVDTFSITDHNNVVGAREARHLTAAKPGLDFIPGVEIDCNYLGTDLHLLAYQVDLDSGDFDQLASAFRQKHMDMIPQMIQNLEKLGIVIDRDELMQKSEGEPPSAELFAEVLLQKPEQQSNPLLKPYFPGGERSDMPLVNFYLDFFAQGKPAYVKFEHMKFEEAVSFVLNKGGIPIVAHPGLNLKDREELVNELLDNGAAGLEVFNNYHTEKQVAIFAELIRKRGAIMTCGSDFHGKIKPLISIGQYSKLGSYKDYLNNSIEKIAEHQR